MPEDTPLQEKLEILTGVARTFALRKELDNRIGNEAESVEIFLYYEILLKERLKLVTAIDQMAYEPIGKRNNIKEDELVEAVKKNYIGELIDIPAFEKVIKEDADYQARISPKRTELEARQEYLDNNQEKMDSGDYVDELNELRDEYRQLCIATTTSWLEEKFRS